MEALYTASLLHQALFLTALLAVLIAPNASTRGRAVLGGGLLIGAGALVVYGVTQAATTVTLEVVNPFFRQGHDEVFLYVTDSAVAHGWVWPLICAVALGIPGLYITTRRHYPKGSPKPLKYATGIALWTLLTRLGLERAAAPAGLVWAVGLTPASILLTGFLGGYNAERGAPFRAFVRDLVAFGCITRVAVAGAGFVATSWGLGTHLDVRVVTDFQPPGRRNQDLADAGALERWWHAVAIPQGTWLLVILVLGLVLGGIAYAIVRRRHPTSVGSES